MKKLIGLVLVLFAIAGCRPTDGTIETENPSELSKQDVGNGRFIYSYWAVSPDGRRVPCLETSNGLSCDWSAR